MGFYIGIGINILIGLVVGALVTRDYFTRKNAEPRRGLYLGIAPGLTALALFLISRTLIHDYPVTGVTIAIIASVIGGVLGLIALWIGVALVSLGKPSRISLATMAAGIGVHLIILLIYAYLGLTFATLVAYFFFLIVAFLIYALANGSNSLRRYILTRVLLTIPMIFILLTTIFVLMRLLPGDPVSARMKPGSDQQQMEELRKEIGLDKPMHEQYLNYLSDVLQGDLGRSATNNREVSDMISQALPATLELVLPATLITIVIGVFLGAFAAHHHKDPADYGLRLFGVLIYSFPIFWMGLLFQLFFGVTLNWLPTSKRISGSLVTAVERHTDIYLIDTFLTGFVTDEWAAFGDVVRHLILPTLTLSLALIGVFIRLTRVNMIDTLQEDFVLAARARGIPENRVVYRHTLRNAVIPVMTLIGLQLAILVGGAILTETTFSWPGMGLMIKNGIENRDYPAVQGAVTIFAIFVAFVSLVTDILYAFVDPRIRY